MKNIGLIAAGFIAATVVFKGKEILEITKNKYSEIKSQKKEDTQNEEKSEDNSSPKQFLTKIREWH